MQHQPGRSGYGAICVAGNLAGLVLLFLLVCLSPGKLLYDEPDHLAVTASVLKAGLLQTLKQPSPSAPGPLYALVHIAFAPLTKLQPPAIRGVNLGLLAGILFLVVKSGRVLKLSHPVLAASTILVVPFMYPVAGMALTEMPALFFFTLFCLLYLKLMGQREDLSAAGVLPAIVAGLALGLACLGRQTYLCALVATPLILTRNPRSWLALFLVVTSTLLASSWLFWVWGGIVPPGLKAVGGFSLPHGLLSFAYFGLATCFVAPGWLKLDRLSLAAAAALGVAVLLLPFPAFTPATGLAQKLLPGWLFAGYQRLAFGALAGLAGLWLLSLVARALEVRADRSWLFLYLLVLLVALTPSAIAAQFSSRYVATGLGLLVLLLGREIKAGPSALLRFTCGIFLGLATLASYYYY